MLETTVDAQATIIINNQASKRVINASAGRKSVRPARFASPRGKKLVSQ